MNAIVPDPFDPLPGRGQDIHVLRETARRMIRIFGLGLLLTVILSGSAKAQTGPVEDATTDGAICGRDAPNPPEICEGAKAVDGEVAGQTEQGPGAPGTPTTGLEGQVGETTGTEVDANYRAVGGAETEDIEPTLTFFSMNDAALARELEAGNITLPDALRQAAARGVTVYLCGLTFRRSINKAYARGAVFTQYDWGARLGGPTIQIPGLGNATFAACNRQIQMAVQARLTTVQTREVIFVADRNPLTGLLFSTNLYSGSKTPYYTNRTYRWRVRGNVHVKVQRQPLNEFVVGVTYDTARTDDRSIRCSKPSAFERTCVADSESFG